MTDQPKHKVILEEIKVKSSQLKEKIQEVLEEGNARRIIVKKDDRTIIEFPLAIGVGGAAAAVLLAPYLTALGAIAALVTDVDVLIERDVTDDSEPATELEEENSPTN